MEGLASPREEGLPRFLLYHQNDNFCPRGAFILVLLRLQGTKRAAKGGAQLPGRRQACGLKAPLISTHSPPPALTLKKKKQTTKQLTCKMSPSISI